MSYVLGFTSGALGFKLGDYDIFLRKYSSTGSVVWTRQFGTTGFDVSSDVVVVRNFIYTLSRDNSTGFTIRKWNGSDSLLMTIQNSNANIYYFGSDALVVDSLGNIHVVTQYYTGNDVVARLFSYDIDGTFLTSNTIFKSTTGTAYPYDLIIDASDNLYLSVRVDVPGKGAYLKKLSTAGTTLWTRRLEPTSSSNAVYPLALALDSTNNVYVSGSIYLETFPGFSNDGDSDLYTLKYSPRVPGSGPFRLVEMILMLLKALLFQMRFTSQAIALAIPIC